MGFLRRFGGGGGRRAPQPGGPEWPPAGPITTWPEGESFSSKFPAVVFLPKDQATVEVSGASKCQDTLELVSGGRTAGGPRVRDQVAMLLPEPSDTGHPDAVRVVVLPRRGGQPWGKVGYLLHGDAIRYRPVIDRCASLGKVTACHAALTGGIEGAEDGAEDGAAFGVTLFLDEPGNLMAQLDKAFPA